MLPFAAIVIGATLLAQLLQHSLPAFDFLHGARMTIFPVLLAYGSLALPYPLVLAMAFCTGLLWDLLNLQVITSTATLLKIPSVEIAVGTNVVLYGLFCTLDARLPPAFSARALGGARVARRLLHGGDAAGGIFHAEPQARRL